MSKTNDADRAPVHAIVSTPMRHTDVWSGMVDAENGTGNGAIAVARNRSGAMSEKCSSATLCPRCGKCDQWEVDLTRCAGCGVMCCDDCITFRGPACDPPNGDFLCDECDKQNGQGMTPRETC